MKKWLTKAMSQENMRFKIMVCLVLRLDIKHVAEMNIGLGADLNLGAMRNLMIHG